MTSRLSNHWFRVCSPDNTPCASRSARRGGPWQISSPGTIQRQIHLVVASRPRGYLLLLADNVVGGCPQTKGALCWRLPLSLFLPCHCNKCSGERRESTRYVSRTVQVPTPKQMRGAAEIGTDVSHSHLPFGPWDLSRPHVNAQIPFAPHAFALVSLRRAECRNVSFRVYGSLVQSFGGLACLMSRPVSIPEQWREILPRRFRG